MLVCFILSVTNTLGYYEIRDVFTAQAPDSCITKLFKSVNNSEVLVTYTLVLHLHAMLEPTQVEHLFGTLLLALTVNKRLG